jgi:fucose permease
MTSTQEGGHVLVRFWPLWLSKLMWGMFWATWGAMVPAVQSRLGLTDAGLGEQLMMVVVGVLPATFIGGCLWTRLGRWQLPLTLLVYAAGTLWLGHVQSGRELGMALLICGVASGMLEVTLACMIACAQDMTGKRLFSVGQAIFPLAVVVSAPAVGWMRREGVEPAYIFEGLAALMLAAAILTSLSSLRFPTRPRDTGGPVRGAQPRFSAPLAVLMLMGFFLYVLEHAVNHWSALYLQRDLGADAFLASWGPSIYMGAACIGRLAVHGMGHRLTDLPVIVFGFAAGAAALLWVGSATAPGFALAGYLAAGLLMSPAIPAIYSLSTSIADPQTRMRLLGNLSTVCNIGYVVSPLAFGSMSSAYGMPFSWRMMSAAAVICLGMLLLAQFSGMFRPRAAAGIINDV